MDPEPSPARRRPWITVTAWLVTLAIVMYVAWDAAHTLRPSDVTISAELAVRAQFGMRAMSLPANESLRGELIGLDAGGTELRQRGAVMAGDVWGLTYAAPRVEWAAKGASEAGGRTAEVQRVLAVLYPKSAPDGETQAQRVERLSAEDRALLVRELGWFGRLALAPEGGDAAARAAVMSAAKRTLIVMAIAVTIGGLAFLAGLALVGVAVVMLFLSKLKLHHDVPPGHHTFGAETFALWLVVFVGSGLLAKLLPWDRWGPNRSAILGVSLAVEFATLAVLVAPVLRGIPWSTVRRRVGWHCGKGVVREVAAGFVGVCVQVVFVAAGLVASVMLRQVLHHRHEPGEGTHPVTRLVAESATGDAVLLFLLAAVAAPVIEETMFRGVLFGHLREATSRWPRAGSVLFAGTVSSVLFAAVHPQGWTVMPVLAAMGFAMCLVREWRGSLIAPMVMHGLWNGGLLLVVRNAMAP